MLAADILDGMKVARLSAAAAFLICLPLRAESSCDAVTRLTDLADRELKTLHASATVPKAVIHAITRDLEIATNASHSCTDRDAKLHLAAVKAMLSDILLAISDTDKVRH